MNGWHALSFCRAHGPAGVWSRNSRHIDGNDVVDSQQGIGLSGFGSRFMVPPDCCRDHKPGLLQVELKLKNMTVNIDKFDD
jgi:hypothetical protein